MKRLAIITTHPIQYNAPFFKLLNERGKVYPKVFYTWPQAIEGFEDPDFKKKVTWDIPLLEGYSWEAVENQSKTPSSKRWSGIDCPTLRKQIKNFDPNAILVYGWNLKSHFKTMRYFKGRIPIWFTGDSTLLDESTGWRKLIRRISLSWIYRNVDKAFYVGTNNKEYFKAHGLSEKQLVYFPHAVDNNRFEDNEEKQYELKAQKWRKELGYSVDDMVVLFAGKFETKKNPELLIRAIKQINSESKDLTAQRSIHLVLIGNGMLEPSMREVVARDVHIRFLPFQNQSQMPVVYRLGDIFCLPSKGPHETWGLAINEAMASSRPVLVSDKVGCAVDLVKSGISGEIFRSGDISDSIHKLLKLLKGDFEAMQAKAKKHILNWNFKKKCEAIERTF